MLDNLGKQFSEDMFIYSGCQLLHILICDGFFLMNILQRHLYFKYLHYIFFLYNVQVIFVDFFMHVFIYNLHYK